MLHLRLGRGHTIFGGEAATIQKIVLKKHQGFWDILGLNLEIIWIFDVQTVDLFFGENRCLTSIQTEPQTYQGNRIFRSTVTPVAAIQIWWCSESKIEHRISGATPSCLFHATCLIKTLSLSQAPQAPAASAENNVTSLTLLTNPPLSARAGKSGWDSPFLSPAIVPSPQSSPGIEKNRALIGAKALKIISPVECLLVSSSARTPKGGALALETNYRTGFI